MLLSLTKVQYNLEGAAQPKSVCQIQKLGIPTRSKHEPRSAWRYRKASLASRALLRSETSVRPTGTGVVTPGTEENPEMCARGR